MGRDAKAEHEPEALRAFTRSMLKDLRALEKIIESGMIESGVRRIGVEQELFLVDAGWRPAPVAIEVLEKLVGDSYSTELARFNLEINLDPLELAGGTFSTLHQNLMAHIDAVRAAASDVGADVVLTGILPTLNKSDLSLDNITPRDRYYALNEAVSRLRGGSMELHIMGVDELHLEHDSVMLESCNTSFQVHLQVAADEFADHHNVAQAVAGPVLAACVNSPLLFGKRLWRETRIALFQQSVDTRQAMPHLRDSKPRVRFGDNWISSSVVELFQEDIARFRALIPMEIPEDPLVALEQGEIPELGALQLHNSTVYRWNRPCYGISGDQPHLRIECRFIPSGPTVIDEVANTAFWVGSVLGATAHFGDITKFLDFDDARGNFIAAARHGINATFTWLNDETVGAQDLVLERLLPLAREGLETARVDSDDIDKYLGIVEQRVKSCGTGSVWILRSLAGMKDEGTRHERLAALTGAMVDRQNSGVPGHEWDHARLEEAGGWRENYLHVEQYMTTELFTVHEDELVDLVAFLMDRKQIRHVMVEDDNHKPVGLVSYRSLLRLLTRGQIGELKTDIPVKEVMVKDPITVAPETTTIAAINIMREHGVSVLPVVKDGKLVGAVGERDFMPIARHFIEEKLREE